MKSFTLPGVALGAILVLGGCASSYDIDSVAMMNNQGDAFTTALQKRYVERATFEKGEQDWGSVKFFSDRAKMAAMGETVALQDISERSLKVDATPIQLSSMQLMSALNGGAAKSAPDACARAQTWLEHWMEQSEEGHQPDDIAEARNGFNQAMPECKGMPAKPAMVPDLKPLVVYFTFNSAEISSGGAAEIKRAVDAAKDAGVKSAVVIGHTDRSGDAKYNMALSKKRAEAVSAALMAQGIGAKIDSSFAGETSPAEATEDGVKSRLNRRVEVIFGR